MPKEVLVKPSLPLLAVASVAAFSVPLAAQEVPKPAPELARLKALEGNWEGSGTVTPEAGQEGMKWTSKGTSTWVLGGFWLQTDMTIDFGGSMPALQFREYHGWDGENQRYVAAVVSNEGRVKQVRVHFAGPDTIITMEENVMDGMPETSREVTKFAGD